jgi:hypothetical protein
VSKCPKVVVSRHVRLKCGSFASLTHNKGLPFHGKFEHWCFTKTQLQNSCFMGSINFSLVKSSLGSRLGDLCNISYVSYTSGMSVRCYGITNINLSARAFPVVQPIAESMSFLCMALSSCVSSLELRYRTNWFDGI